jgi:hypothetical protein
MNPYMPYDITFNATGFKWQDVGYRLNVPEFERITFSFVSSSLEPKVDIKYGVRILSLFDNTLLQRQIDINNGDGMKKVTLNLTNTSEFNVVIRGLVKMPNRFTKDASISVWSIQDTVILYTGRFRYKP